jgi:hypothetical protein
MRNFVLALSIMVLGLSPAAAQTRRVVTAPEVPTWGWYWAYTPAPWGANQPVLTYGPDNQRCVSILLQAPNRWWMPHRRCDIVGAQ